MELTYVGHWVVSTAEQADARQNSARDDVIEGSAYQTERFQLVESRTRVPHEVQLE